MYRIELTKNKNIPYFRQFFVFNYIVNKLNNDYNPSTENIKLSYAKEGIIFYVNTKLQVDNIEKLLNNNIKELLENDDAFSERRTFLLCKYQELLDSCLKYFCERSKKELEEIFTTNNIQIMTEKLKQVINSAEIEEILAERKGFNQEQIDYIRSMIDEEYEIRPC